MSWLRKVVILFIGWVFPPSLFAIAYPIVSSYDWPDNPELLYLKSFVNIILVLIWVIDWAGTVFLTVKWVREAITPST